MGLDLGIVIVSHNSSEDMPACLASVFAHAGGAELGVVVSDAGSTDGTADLTASFPVTAEPADNVSRNWFSPGRWTP